MIFFTIYLLVTFDISVECINDFRIQKPTNGFFSCQTGTSKAYCRESKQICDTSSGQAECICAPGWQGSNCDINIDECSSNYPCPGEKGISSFCVDDVPPIKYKCGCQPGFKPLVSESDSPELGVPKEFRPTDCVAVTTCEDFPCHEDAYCLITAAGPSCICREGFAGDGKNRCGILRPTPRSLSGMKSTPTIKIVDVGDSCNATMKCNPAYSNCHNGRCQCKSGFVQRKKVCVNIDECEVGYPNMCDFNAKCIDRVGTYDCECKDGFRDSNPNNLPGRQCQQANECLDGTHDCGPDKVCVDRRPPMKWECVDKTPAPTRAPTRAPQRASTNVASPDPWPYGTFYYILYLTQSGVTHTLLLDEGCDVIDNFGLSGCSGNSVKVTGTLGGSISSLTGFSGVATLQIQVAPRSIIEKGCPSLEIGTSCTIDYDWYCDSSWLDCPA